jgi:hypothetical protein
MILGGESISGSADLNGDGTVNILDVVVLIGLILDV